MSGLPACICSVEACRAPCVKQVPGREACPAVTKSAQHLQGCTCPEWHYVQCPCADTAPGLHLQVNKLDWIVFNAAWLGVMFAGVEIGLAIAIGTSILLVLYKTGFPHMAVLGRLPQTTVYRWARQLLHELCSLLSAAAVPWCPALPQC